MIKNIIIFRSKQWFYPFPFIPFKINLPLPEQLHSRIKRYRLEPSFLKHCKRHLWFLFDNRCSVRFQKLPFFFCQCRFDIQNTFLKSIFLYDISEFLFSHRMICRLPQNFCHCMVIGTVKFTKNHPSSPPIPYS